ncbi:hypothetical protein ALC53_12082 [Atta colombica]|uniref:Uncharacterized protein n=1 Tax=Atta colombica TaxID=520822 RepID=A0A195AYY3_9HYME|nr:hypothetical protein ALC53_12082 [Atta colombica]
MNMINDNNLLLPHHLRNASYTLNLLATTDFYNALKNSTVHSRIHYAVFGKCSALWNASFAKFFELSSEVNEAIIASCFHRILNLCINSMDTMETISDRERLFSFAGFIQSP